MATFSIRGLLGNDIEKFLFRELVSFRVEKFLFLPDHDILNFLDHSVKGRFGGIGNEGEDGVAGIITDGFENTGDDEFAEFFPFIVDILVGSAGEIDPFKGTGFPFIGLKHLFDLEIAVFPDDDNMPRGDFLDFIVGHIQWLSGSPVFRR